jgi:hypothetical protein
VNNSSEVQMAIDRARIGQPLAITIRRENGLQVLTLRPAELPRKG